jgi:hypothetical protein
MLEPGVTKRVARLGQTGLEGSLAGANVTAPTLARSGQQMSNGGSGETSVKSGSQYPAPYNEG